MTVPAGHAQVSSRTWGTRLATLLDLVILVELVALAVSLLGGIDLGWISAARAAKPALVLILLVPIRLALPLSSPLSAALGRARARALARGWGVNGSARLPPAFRDVLFAVAVTQLGTLAVAFLVNLLFPPVRPRPFEMPFAAQKFAEIFAAWDSGWYFDIARRGYYYNPDGQSSIAFFPLYPLLMRALAWPFGTTDRAVWLAGIFVSASALIAGLVVLHRLTERIFGDREVARRTIIYIAVFPFSFFFLRVYTESLFLLLSVLAVSAAYASKWWHAGVWGGLAALTRPNGILIAIPLLLLAASGRPAPRELLGRTVALAPVPLAVLGFCAYVYAVTGDPLAWLDAQRHWEYSVGDAPWRQLLKLGTTLERYGPYDMFFTNRIMPYQAIHGTVAVLFLALSPLVFQRVGVALGAYVLASLFVPLSGSDLQGIGRYSAVLFPVFIALGSLRSPRVHEAILVISSLFLALCAALFVTWHPIF